MAGRIIFECAIEVWDRKCDRNTEGWDPVVRFFQAKGKVERARRFVNRDFANGDSFVSG